MSKMDNQSINIHLVCSRKVINNNHSHGSGVALIFVALSMWKCDIVLDRTIPYRTKPIYHQRISQFSKKKGSNSWSIGQGREHLKFIHRTPNKTDLETESEIKTKTKTKTETKETVHTVFVWKTENSYNSKAFPYFEETKEPTEKSCCTNKQWFILVWVVWVYECASVYVWFGLCFVCPFDTCQRSQLIPSYMHIERLSILFSPHWTRQQIIFGKCSRV